METSGGSSVPKLVETPQNTRQATAQTVARFVKISIRRIFLRISRRILTQRHSKPHCVSFHAMICFSFQIIFVPYGFFLDVVLAKGRRRGATSEISQTRQYLVSRQTNSCVLEGRRISPVPSRGFHRCHQHPAGGVKLCAGPNRAGREQCWKGEKDRRKMQYDHWMNLNCRCSDRRFNV